MKKLFTQNLFIIILLGSIFFSSCNANKHKPSEYISATGIASPGIETKVELVDGAGIVVPADSIEEEISIKVERNPEKAKLLQPLDESFIQVSDFYNFEINGNINAPVDLILPFNVENIPNETGILVYAYPTGNGWEYIPVASDGNKVRLYTANIGDPLIAWHFVKTDEMEEIVKNAKYCNPRIAVNVIPESGEGNQDYKVVGRIQPLDKDITTKLGDKLASLILGQETSSFGNLPIEVIINNDPQRTISAHTNQDGSFEITINPEKDSPLGFKEKINWLQVKTQCDSLLTSRMSEAVGYSAFYINPKEQTEQTPPTELPVVEQPTETPIPTGSVLLPDFIGQPIDNAINWLESNGFKYSWIDGSSVYDLGMVYNQAPVGNQYKVPHRTVVVLYRTIEHVVDPCIELNLTPDECANLGNHQFNRTSCTISNDDDNSCHCGGTANGVIEFSGDEVILKYNPSGDFQGGEAIYTKQGQNIYTNSGSDWTGTLTFSDIGFLIVTEAYTKNNKLSCIFHETGTLVR